MPTRPGFSSISGLSCSTSWVAGEPVAEVAVSGSADVPDVAHLARLEVSLTSISSATELTFFLSHDAAGAEALTPHQSDGATQTLSLSPNDQATGSAVWTLEGLPFLKRDGLHVWLKLDQGTATAAARVVWEVLL